jgi:hypothetical protein
MEPHLRVGVESVQPAGAGTWLVTWSLASQGEPVALESAWVPHGRFRGAGRLNFSPARELPLSLAMTVHADEAPGTVVENAFLILRLSTGWRVFVRMRVEFDASGEPRPIPELVTLQSPGASD